MSSEKKLRFRIRRGDFEVELEGDHDYVRERFEDLEKTLGPTGNPVVSSPSSTSMSTPVEQPIGITGVVEFTSEGKPHLTVPVDTLSAKEAISLVMFSLHPKPLGDDDLSSLLSSSWKTTGESIVRARISELRREGKVIAERGNYVLSGAGVQWIQNDILPRLQKTT
ncbi:MAG TPA: hypothetical protein VFV92_11595 [Candidatus Bathyarchaeia archaeon]|nr:hypothetical protein [Candidatus Bathyarchaeia archaeon]